MKRGFVALVVAVALGASPAAADPGTVGAQPPAPTDDQDWTEPTASVATDPADLVEDSGDSGAMTVVYAVKDGDSLSIETQRARSATDAASTIAEIQTEPDVLAVDVDTTRYLTGMPYKTSRDPASLRSAARVAVAADPARDQQWALDTLQAETAWTSSTGSGVTVAVIDSGVAPHPDLAGRFVRGKDFVDGTNGRADMNGHGTHVAGIIAMTANNNVGGAGLAPDVAIMPVVVADADGSVRAADSAKGIIWATDHGADILNMSYSGPASAVEEKAIQYAQSKGAVTVAAVGNAYLDASGSLDNPIQYPAAYKGVLGVGSITKSLDRSSFSEVGRQVDVVAPGGNGAFNSSRGIFSTYLGGAYVRMPGTSMAAPYASATMALTIGRERSTGVSPSPTDVLLGSAIDLGAPGRDDDYGFGLINPVGAMELLARLKATGSPLPAITPAEVTTRKVYRIRIKMHDGYLRYRIPAKGRFIVAWQRFQNSKWSDPSRFKGKRKGKTWYTVTTAGGLKVRMLAVRKKSKKNGPIWISPTVRTRSASPR